jgi:hypothetical protein
MRRALPLALLLTVGIAAPSSPLRAADAPGAAVRFLEVGEAAAAIGEDAAEPYFARMQSTEMAVKTGGPLAATDLDAQREECRKRYQEAVRPFSDDEKSALAAAAHAVDAALRPTYPFVAESSWTFVKIGPSIEGTLPFTHGACIVLPDGFAQRFVAAKGKGEDPAKSWLGETLVREKCLVIQRAHPAHFADLYVNGWGFVRAKGLGYPAALAATQALDADCADVGWAFPAKDGADTAYWQPLLAFDEKAKSPKLPKDLFLVGAALDRKGAGFVHREGKDGRPEIRFLDAIPAFTATFGRLPDRFHPAKAFATIFASIAAKDHLGVAEPTVADRTGVDVARVREWCRRKLASSPPRTR